MQIRQIIDKINDNQLFVPAFQREYVWKRGDVKALFDSLIKRYPTGTLLTWETTNPPELKGSKKYSEQMGAVKLLLDGQQRVTSIYLILEGKLTPYYTEEEIANPNVMGLHVNLETLELEYFKKMTMENNPRWVNLTDIFLGKIRSKDVRKVLESKEELTDELEDLIDDNFDMIKSIQDREFPEQIIPVTATIKEAIDIFYIVNSSGVNLTDAELALAQISGYWPQARDLFKKKLFEMEKHGFVFKLDFIVYALLAVIHHNGSQMEKLHSVDNKQRLHEAWERLETQTLDYVANILKTHAYIDHTDEINSIYAIIPIIAFVFHKPNGQLNESEIKRIVKWFYYSQIRSRYVSQLPQKLDKDLGVVKSSTKPFEELLGIIEQERSLQITAGEFVGRDIRHPLFSMMKWYFKHKNAVCLTSGVSIRKNMGKKYTLEKDHIFPYSALKANGYDLQNRFKYALAQEITNRAILARVENRTKSATPAKDYLSMANSEFPSALEKQCIPQDESIWQLEKFEDFLETRRQLIATELNEFLENITTAETVHGALDILDIIQDDEHEALEFKSSLRWDLRENKINKALEKVVLKTISAFNNGYGDGGTLLIGVSDDGEILGLDADFATLKGSNQDAFELHLRNLIINEYGNEYAASSVVINFHIIDEQAICSVEVNRGSRPLFLKDKDKNGSLVEKFYVRTGNQSALINSTSEVTDFVQKRFS